MLLPQVILLRNVPPLFTIHSRIHPVSDRTHSLVVKYDVIVSSGNHLHNLTSSVDPSMSPSDRISDMSVTTTSLDNMPQSSAPVSQSGMFQTGMTGTGMAGTGMAGTTPPKEYSQSSTMHTEVGLNAFLLALSQPKYSAVFNQL